MGEVDKLEAFADGRKDDHARGRGRACCGRGLGQPLYMLARRLRGARRGRESSSDVSGCSTTARRAVRILATLHRSLRQVRGAVALREARASRDEIGAALAAAEHAVQARRAARGRAALDRGGPAAGALGPRPGGPPDEEGWRRRGGPGRGRGRGRARSEGRAAYFAAARALTLRVRRLLYREAALSWTTPFFAALSISPTVSGQELLRGLGVALGDGGAELLHLGLELGEFCRLRARRFRLCLILLLGRRVMCQSSSSS